MIAAGVFDLPVEPARLVLQPHPQLRRGDRPDRRRRDGDHRPADAEEHQGNARDAAAGAGDAQVAGPVPQRPHEAQRRDDEALPGAQGQSVVVVPAAAGPDAGVHHHVPGPLRLDLPPKRRQRRAGPGHLRGRRVSSASRSASSPATSPTTASCSSPSSARPRWCRSASTWPSRRSPPSATASAPG